MAKMSHSSEGMRLFRMKLMNKILDTTRWPQLRLYIAVRLSGKLR